MTELIVAIDTFDSLKLIPSLMDIGVKWFKFHHLQHGEVPCRLEEAGCHWFYDRKIYDTKDTVHNLCTHAFDLGAKFITVHTTPSMLESAMKAKTNLQQKIIAVGPLTDNPDSATITIAQAVKINMSDGFICSDPTSIKFYKEFHHLKDKIFICPGIRPWNSDPNNHYQPHTPLQAKNYGADYIIVGRPITLSADPLGVAQSILDEIKD